jgi:hypothetical protein
VAGVLPVSSALSLPAGSTSLSPLPPAASAAAASSFPGAGNRDRHLDRLARTPWYRTMFAYGAGTCAASRRRHEQPIRHEAVQVRIQIQRPAEALREGHRAGLPVADAERTPAPSLPGEHRPQEGPEESREQPPVDRQARAQHPGKRQHPLAVRRLQQELVDQVGGDVRHTPPDGLPGRTIAAMRGRHRPRASSPGGRPAGRGR